MLIFIMFFCGTAEKLQQTPHVTQTQDFYRPPWFSAIE